MRGDPVCVSHAYPVVASASDPDFFRVIPGRLEEASPESRDSGSGAYAPSRNDRRTGLLPPSRSRASADSYPAKLAQASGDGSSLPLLAMTARQASTFPRHYRTRVIARTSSHEDQRAQGKPDA